MTRKWFLLILISILWGHNPEKNIPRWIAYSRGGLVNVKKNNSGGATYFRLKRTTNYTFRDVRFYAHIFGSDQDIRFRQKSSRRFVSLPWLYNFTTASYQRNTLVDVALRYHYNQGLGILIRNTDRGNMTTEMGMAYDMSDYLDGKQKTSYLKQKTSYLKIAFTHDKYYRYLTTKLELDYFHQISDINVYNLSRFQVLAELQWEFYQNLKLIGGIYQELPTDKLYNNQNALIYVTIDWSKQLQWSY